jgi:endogenous inhibitor of DNA gyrase (YacG/DUF329 family)
MIDLGRWSAGEYVLASNEPLSEEDIEEIIKKQSEELGHEVE